MREEFQFDDRMDFIRFGMWIGKAIVLLDQVEEEMEIDKATDETLKKLKQANQYLDIA